MCVLLEANIASILLTFAFASRNKVELNLNTEIFNPKPIKPGSNVDVFP